MSKLGVGFGLAVAGVAVAAAFLAQRDDNAKLRREIAMLRTDVHMAVAAARREPSKPAAPATPAAEGIVIAERGEMANEDLAKLREEIVALRQSTQQITRLAQAAQAKNALEAQSAIATDLMPTSAIKNAGKGTPEATAETLMWAAVGGEIETLAQALTFPPSARAKADAWFAGLSDATRKEYGSPEKLIALMIAKDADKLGGMQILGQRAISADDVGVRMRFSDVQGNIKDDNFLLHRSSDGWRLVLPDSAVEKFARQVSGGRK